MPVTSASFLTLPAAASVASLLGPGETHAPGSQPPGHQPNPCTRPRMLSSMMTLPTRIINGWSGIL
jgi:hypothetical protein